MNRNTRLGRRTSMQSAVRTAVETLEERRLMTNVYQSLPFSENWTDTGRITTTVNTAPPITPPNTAGWDNVPGFVAYRGDDLTTLTGVDPQTIVAPGDTTPNNINANQANPNTFTSGGVAEFEITNPVVAIQGSGTSDVPNLQLHLNTTGVPVVRVQYQLRDVDGSTDNAVQPVALQYRIGSSGNFINVPSAFIADASTGPSLADATFNVNVVLPAEAGNQPQLQLRWVTTNAVGNDEWIGIDDINITAGSTAGAFNFANNGVFTTLENSGNATITINRNDGSTGAVSVRARTILGGTATTGADYTAVDTIVNFANGQTSATFDVPILQDGLVEGAESVFLSLSDPTGGAQLGGVSGGTLFIGDDDTAPPTNLLVNELNINPPGATDNPYEYAEIRGASGGTLGSVYFVSIEGEADTANPGNASFVQDLSGFSLGSNGLLVIKAQTGGHAIPGGTTVVGNATLSTIAALQNGSNTYAVIFSPLPIVQNSDLDTNNDGALDLGPGSIVLDAVGWVDGTNLDPGNPDRVYGPELILDTAPLPPLSFARDSAPDIATRFPGDNAANNAQSWYYGEPNQATGTNADLAYVATQTSNPGGIPAGTPVLTPGALNYPQPADNTPPTVTGQTFVFNSAPTPQTVQVTFDEDVSASLAAGDFTLTNVTTSTVVPTASITLSYNGGTNVASLTFPTFSNGILPDGNYSLGITGAVSDAAGNPLTVPSPFSFFTLAGDSDRDKDVDLDDFTTLASFFGTSGRTVSTGDNTYNGVVDLDDFTTLASNFGKSLPAGLPRASGTVAASPFSATKIDDKLVSIASDVIA